MVIFGRMDQKWGESVEQHLETLIGDLALSEKCRPPLFISETGFNRIGTSDAICCDAVQI